MFFFTCLEHPKRVNFRVYVGIFKEFLVPQNIPCCFSGLLKMQGVGKGIMQGIMQAVQMKPLNGTAFLILKGLRHHNDHESDRQAPLVASSIPWELHHVS